MDQAILTGNGTTEKILIVDDDRDTCQLLQFLFQRKGYRTMVATDGRQAIHQVQSEPPDLVLMDILMPDMDGLETFRRVREFSTAPVLFLTALDSIECAAQAFHLGAVDYMRKPCSNTELLLHVQIALSLAKDGASASGEKGALPSV